MKPITALLALLLALAPASAVLAASPPGDAKVDELLTLMRAQKNLEATLPMIQASQEQTVQQLTAGQPLTDEQRRKLDDILAKSRAQIATMLSWEKMQPLYRDIYRKTFSAEDIDAMIGFYGSQAGQNLLDKMPQLMQHTMTAMQELMVPMLQQMQKDIQSEAAKSAAGEPPADDGA